MQQIPDIDIYIVRHGRSLGQDDISAYKTIGDSRIPLTEIGFQQAINAGEFLKQFTTDQNIHLMSIFSSACKRAEQTTDKIRSVLSLTLTQTEVRLNKQTFGIFDGLLTKNERAKKYPEENEKFNLEISNNGLFQARPKDGESIQDVYERAASLKNVMLINPIPTILVTHGLVAFCFEAAIMGHEAQWILERENSMPNCAIRRITGNPNDGFIAKTIYSNNMLDNKPIATVS